jgi:2-polyprenyl-6-methoxyphenol hydroxylase-like FAD-dependent oxidoreductase
MEIAVVGCGTAGPAVAAMLRERGHGVVVFERETAPRPIGSGILLQPLGMSVLDLLGVGERVRRLGSRVERLYGVNVARKTVLDLRYADAGADVHGVGVQRGLLFNALMGCAEASGAEIRTGWSIARVEDGRSDGAWVVEEQGRREGPFDCVVIASGSRTLLRNVTGNVERWVEYPWGAWWFTAKMHNGMRMPIGERTLHQVYEHASRTIGFLPSGRMDDDGDETVSCFYSVEREQEQGTRERGLSWLKDEMLRLAPGACDVVGQLRGWEQVLRATYRDVVMRPLHRGRVVCIGDAGHAMSPQLGLGANLALVDAMMLADCLGTCRERKGAWRSLHDVEDAIALFSDQRRRILRYYTWISRLLTPLFQSGEVSLAVVRDVALPVLCRVGWTKRQMLEAMCGTTKGFLGRW